VQLECVRGDITREDVDAIVNAANSFLRVGGGVDLAIHERAGLDETSEACRLLGGCDVGDAKVTPGFNLPAKWVIHTVGPVYSGSEDRSELLASCYRESLRVADELGAQTVAFPAVSAGVYGWPPADAARIALATVHNTPTRVREARFVLFSAEVLNAFRAAVDSGQSSSSS